MLGMGRAAGKRHKPNSGFHVRPEKHSGDPAREGGVPRPRRVGYPVDPSARGEFLGFETFFLDFLGQASLVS
jgi:hypothetical protein